MRHKFQSIKGKGGLAVHLNETKSIHRGFGYKTYRILRVAGLNVTNRARAFSVTFDTMKEWDIIDDGEQAAKKAKQEAEVEALRDA